MSKVEIYIDGASKGNPGPSAVGIIICREGRAIKNISRCIGNATNNIAEYTALIHGLQEGLILNAESIKINTDSELLCRQINRSYKIKSPNLLGLYNEAVRLMKAFKEVSINHIPREDNRGADKLANLALEKSAKRN